MRLALYFLDESIHSKLPRERRMVVATSRGLIKRTSGTTHEWNLDSGLHLVRNNATRAKNPFTSLGNL